MVRVLGAAPSFPASKAGSNLALRLPCYMNFSKTVKLVDQTKWCLTLAKCLGHDGHSNHKGMMGSKSITFMILL